MKKFLPFCFFKGVFFAFISLTGSGISANAQPYSQTFYTAGTYSYTVPVGKSALVIISAWGGGAGGGRNTGNAKGGGGGGAYASSVLLLTSGTYSVTVGAGGDPAVDGENSSFSNLVIAQGGFSTNSHNGGSGGTVLGSTGLTRFAGGNGGNAPNGSGIRGGGGGGGSALSNSTGGNGGNGMAGAPGLGGLGGNGMGSGGRGANDSGTPDATAGISPGSGGGGKGNYGNSQPGADGQVSVIVIAVLPVQFGSVTVSQKNSGVQVDWTVYTEQGVSHYLVERSVDGRNFNSIGSVPAKNTGNETKYQWFESSPVAAVSFYRLKAVDFDQKISYSQIIKLNPDRSNKEFILYPVPVLNNSITIQAGELSEGLYKLSILNMNGQVLLSKVLSHLGGTLTHAISLPANTISGNYILRITRDASFDLSKWFIVK